MDLAQTKKELVEELTAVQDKKVLDLMKSVLEHLKSDDLNQLTDPQKESIEISREQIKAGNFKTQADFFEEVRQWLKKK